jgi:hypothetical protein
MGHGDRIYIWFGVRGLGGIGRPWGLDKQCPPFENAKGRATRGCERTEERVGQPPPRVFVTYNGVGKGRATRQEEMNLASA